MYSIVSYNKILSYTLQKSLFGMLITNETKKKEEERSFESKNCIDANR